MSGLPRLLAGLDPGRRLTLAEHVGIHGELPFKPGLELIEELERAGLRGRGGADFPTARKMGAVAAREPGRRSRGRPSAVVVNGSETEPASGKDRLLLSRLPHLVLDGALLAAGALGAGEMIVKVGENERGSVSALGDSIAERTGDPAPIRVVRGPTGYVAGEESAVIHHLNGGAALPTFVPPRPYERGYRGRPTLVLNTETAAHVALIARFGARWFRELGTDADPGSVLVTVSGAVRAPGVYEVAFGTPLADLLAAAGGSSEPLRAFLVGGYFGTWADAAPALELRLARDDLRSAGCSLGSGVLIALGESACGLHESARVIDYLAAESSGQCGPCVHGLRAVADSIMALAEGVARPNERDRVLRWVGEIMGRGACHHPNGAVRFVASALSVFADDIQTHRNGGCGAPPAGLPLGFVAEEAR